MDVNFKNLPVHFSTETCSKKKNVNCYSVVRNRLTKFNKTKTTRGH